jgi:hypothetical protein
MVERIHAPAEHVLIDALSYRGARVVASTQCNDFGFWLVIRGDIDRKKLSKITNALHRDMSELEEEAFQATRKIESCATAPPETEESANE